MCSGGTVCENINVSLDILLNFFCQPLQVESVENVRVSPREHTSNPQRASGRDDDWWCFEHKTEAKKTTNISGWKRGVNVLTLKMSILVRQWDPRVDKAWCWCLWAVNKNTLRRWIHALLIYLFIICVLLPQSSFQAPHLSRIFWIIFCCCERLWPWQF